MNNDVLHAAQPFCLNYIFSHGLENDFKAYVNNMHKRSRGKFNDEEARLRDLKQHLNYSCNFELYVYSFVTDSMSNDLRAFILEE